MTELDRLLESSRSARTRALLRAGRTETSPDGFSERLLVGLGAATATAAVTSSASASLATGAKLSGAVGGAAVSSGGAQGLALVAAKWVAAGVLGGTVLAAGANVALSPKKAKSVGAPAAAKATRARASSSEPKEAAQHSATALAPPAAEAEPLPSGEPIAVLGAGSAAATRLSNRDAGPLGREVEIIDRVRKALSAGNTARALSELDAYERIATTNVLDREARVLRIRALREAGDVAGAQRLTAAYLTEFPNDAHAARLRAQDSSVKP